MIDDHSYDGNCANGSIDLTDKGIGVVPIMGLTGSIDRLNIDEQKKLKPILSLLTLHQNSFSYFAFRAINHYIFP